MGLIINIQGNPNKTALEVFAEKMAAKETKIQELKNKAKKYKDKDPDPEITLTESDLENIIDDIVDNFDGDLRSIANTYGVPISWVEKLRLSTSKPKIKYF